MLENGNVVHRSQIRVRVIIHTLPQMYRLHNIYDDSNESLRCEDGAQMGEQTLL